MRQNHSILFACLLVAVLTALAIDAVWLFTFALPHNPAAAQPTAPPPSASSAEQNAYRVEIDRAEIQNWERRQTVYTAAGVPLVVIALGVIVLALAKARHPESV